MRREEELPVVHIWGARNPRKALFYRKDIFVYRNSS